MSNDDIMMDWKNEQLALDFILKYVFFFNVGEWIKLIAIDLGDKTKPLRTKCRTYSENCMHTNR